MEENNNMNEIEETKWNDEEDCDDEGESSGSLGLAIAGGICIGIGVLGKMGFDFIKRKREIWKLIKEKEREIIEAVKETEEKSVEETEEED